MRPETSRGGVPAASRCSFQPTAASLHSGGVEASAQTGVAVLVLSHRRTERGAVVAPLARYQRTATRYCATVEVKRSPYSSPPLMFARGVQVGLVGP